MNATDQGILSSDWRRETDAAESAIQEAVKSAQDSAYQLGFDRGFASYHKAIAALESASCALLDAGNKAASEEIDRVIDEIL
jgi:hypothetical protein